MMGVVRVTVILLRTFSLPRASLTAENLALRHQLGVVQRSVKHLRLRRRDRIFWVWLSRLWPGWRSNLMIVKPATIVRWHRKGLKLYWRWKSRSKSGHPKIRRLIRRMSRENPTWEAPRIHSELQLLGYVVAESTVGEYLCCHRKLRLGPTEHSHRHHGARGTPARHRWRR